MSGPEKKVLIVDDDENILFLLSRALMRYGYQVKTAPDGMQAMEILQGGESMDVLLTDMMMPKMSGLELIQHAHEVDPTLEGIVLTAAGSIETAISAMRDVGAYDYLLKPLESMNQLALVVERAYTHRHLVREQALMEEREKARSRWLKALVDNVGEAILVVSASGEITIANPAASRRLGFNGLVGRPVQEVLPARLAQIVENWQQIGAEYPTEMEISWEDGSQQVVSLVPLPEAESDEHGWMLVVRDISLLRQMEEMKTRAVSEVVNRIRMPMAQAMGVVVEMNMLANEDDRLAESLYRLNEHWRRIQVWGDELLALSQMDTERSLPLKKVDLRELFEGVLENLKENPRMSTSNPPTIHVEASWPVLVTNGEMLRALMQGLLNRAIRRSPPRGEIGVYGRVYKDQLWIEINDHGQEAEDLESPHKVEPSPIDGGYESLVANIDLTRAKAALNRVGGQLWLGGEGPRGSMVFISLPGVVQVESA